MIAYSNPGVCMGRWGWGLGGGGGVGGACQYIWYNILTLPLPSLKKSNRTSFYENVLFFLGFHNKRNHLTLFLAIYYDCLVKVLSGPIYYVIIF